MINNNNTYLLTPWCRLLLDKLTGLRLFKKFPAFCGNRMFITAFTNARHVSLSWASSIQSIPLTSQYLKIHLNIILPSTPGYPQWSLFLRFPHQNSVYASPSPIRVTCPAHLNSNNNNNNNNCLETDTAEGGRWRRSFRCINFSEFRPLEPRIAGTNSDCELRYSLVTSVFLMRGSELSSEAQPIGLQIPNPTHHPPPKSKLKSHGFWKRDDTKSSTSFTFQINSAN